MEHVARVACNELVSAELRGAAQFVAGQVVTPEFVQAQWSSAAAGSNGRLQNSAVIQQPGLVEPRDERKNSAINPTKYDTTVERKSERELVVTRTFNGPAHIVFDAWTKPQLLKRWWVPKSFGASFLSCEADVRTDGTYRFVFSHLPSEQPMSFFGGYVKVTPGSRLVWTNDEGDEDGPVTTVIFEESGGETLVVIHELYPSKNPSTMQWPLEV